jgi:hypothetical protein
MYAKPTLITPILLLATLSWTGCEFVGPFLVAEATKDDPAGSTSAELRVEIESASGLVAGTPVAPEMFSPTGERFDNQLTFRLATQGDLEVMVMTETESSSTNPYTGESGLGTDSPDIGRPVPAEGPEGVATISERFSDVLVCQAGTCRSADDFGVELVETDDGRRAVIDGVWGGGEQIEVTLHYTENR